MLNYSRWKTIAILGVTVLVCLAAVPSALPNDVFTQLPAWAQRKFHLGYDLTGGARVQLEVDVADLKRSKLEVLRDDVRHLLRNKQIAHTRPDVRDSGVELTIRDVADMPRTLELLDAFVRPLAASSPVNERRRLLVTNVDGRPSVWAHSNTPALEPSVVSKVRDTTVRLTLTDAALSGYVPRARDASAKFIQHRFAPLDFPYRLHPVGDDRLIFETSVSIDRLNPIQH